MFTEANQGNEGAPPQGTCFHFSVTGGFWALPIAVQTPGAPSLPTLDHQASTCRGPRPSTGWNLQQNTHSVSSVNWGNVTAKVQDDGTTKTLIANPPTDNRFYRLIK